MREAFQRAPYAVDIMTCISVTWEDNPTAFGRIIHVQDHYYWFYYRGVPYRVGDTFSLGDDHWEESAEDALVAMDAYHRIF